MHPLAQAHHDYAAHGLDFGEDLVAYLRNGFVFATPDHLILGRPIATKQGTAWLADYSQADAWFVKYATGTDLPRIIGMMPFPLPFLAWGRFFKGKDDDSIRIYRTDRVRQLIQRQRL